MAAATTASKGIVYRSHEAKLATNARRRVRAFDAAEVPATITDTNTAVRLITGDMILPGELEARILLGIAAAVEEQRRCGDPAALSDVNVGVRLGDEQWPLLDLVLVAYHVDPTSTPLTAVAELMLVFKLGYVGLFGHVASLVDVFEAQYESWSRLPSQPGGDNDDDEVRRRTVAANQFRYACALNAMRKGTGETLDHFALAYIAAASADDHHRNDKAPGTTSSMPMRHQAFTVMLQLLRAKASDNYCVVSPRSGVEYELVDAETVTVNGQPLGVVVPQVKVVGRLFAPRGARDGGVPASSWPPQLSTGLVVAVASVAAAVSAGMFVWTRLRKQGS